MVLNDFDFFILVLVKLKNLIYKIEVWIKLEKNEFLLIKVSNHSKLIVKDNLRPKHFYKLAKNWNQAKKTKWSISQSKKFVIKLFQSKKSFLYFLVAISCVWYFLFLGSHVLQTENEKFEAMPISIYAAKHAPLFCIS